MSQGELGGGGGWGEPYRERTQTGGHKMKSPRAGVRGVEGVRRVREY